MTELIQKKVRAAIVQDPIVSQFGKKNIIVNVMINGNDAIDRACADDGDVIAAMKYILSVLPEPRRTWLVALAVVAGIEVKGTKIEAAKYLGIDRTRLSPRNNIYEKKVKAIQDGQISFGNEKMSSRNEMVQQDG